MAQNPIEAMLADLEAQGIRYLRFEITDLHGTSRQKLVPLQSALRHFRNGLQMYGGLLGTDAGTRVVPGTGQHEETNYSDQFIVPDPETVRVVPWLKDTAKVICDSQRPAGTPLAPAPRTVFRSLLDQADGLGIEVVLAHEYEFYLLNRTPGSRSSRDCTSSTPCAISTSPSSTTCSRTCKPSGST